MMQDALGYPCAASTEEGECAAHRGFQRLVQGHAQLLAGAVQPCLDRFGPNIQQRCRFLDRTALNIAQDEHQPEGFGQIIDCAFQQKPDL